MKLQPVVVGQVVMAAAVHYPPPGQQYALPPHQQQQQPQHAYPQPQPYQPQYYVTGVLQQQQSTYPIAGTVQTYTPGPPTNFGTPGSTSGIAIAGGGFATAVCGCFDDLEGFIEILFCQPCQQSRQYNMVKHGKPEIEPVTCLGSIVADAVIRSLLVAWYNASPGGIAVLPFAMFFLPWTQGLLHWHLRRKLEAKYGVRADSSEDAMVTVFATPCGVCQHYREMSIRGDWPRGCCISTPFVARAPPPNMV